MFDLFHQPSYEPPLTGRELAERGMNKALVHADEVNDNWSGKALEFLIAYAGYTKEEFMCEDVRLASIHTLPEPPHKRAWGGIFRKASNMGIIKCVGIKKVNNPKAHNANAACWVSVKAK